MMPHYRFTTADCVRGGKSRAAQAAAYRIDNPTKAEAFVRKAVAIAFPDTTLRFEYPIKIDGGLTLYVDIMAFSGDKSLFAIEVDGSNGWHGGGLKGAQYDELKARWLFDNQILLIVAIRNQWRHIGDLANWIKEQKG